jgi:hypothetical protein
VWYQKRFLLPGQTELQHLDLHPHVSIDRSDVEHKHRDLYPRGPKFCFYKDDLYTLSFGRETTDEMERRFFGHIDESGHKAVRELAEFNGISNSHLPSFQHLVSYIGAQRFRTPRGLDDIRKRAAWRQMVVGQNSTLAALADGFQAYQTMWMEAIWEVVRARESATKFIITDDPVTFYCKLMFKSEWDYPNGPELKQIGTRTLFPLGLDSCLIITHTQLVRNLWSTPTETRENARSFERVMMHLGTIQFGRELLEDEVLRINYILKKRATRYVAAAREEWLYPERSVSTTDWTLLDDDRFLLPHLWKVPFTTGMAGGGGKAPPWAVDEYGYRPWERGYQDKRRREREHVSCDRGKLEWAKGRVGKPIAHIDKSEHDEVHDRMMREYLEAEGLLQKKEVTQAG